MIEDVPKLIICKATKWFLIRIAIVFTMFSVFAVMFYIDGTTGYRKKNLEYYLHVSFEKAALDFSKMKREASLSGEQWKRYAETQYVSLPDDLTLLPEGIRVPMVWPEVLRDMDQMSKKQAHLLWEDYSGREKFSNNPPKKAFDRGKIREQMTVFYICLLITGYVSFIGVRNLRRCLKADELAFTSVTGQAIPYESMKILDLRKWDTKGIAFIDYESEGKSKRTKVDGLIYGGFNHDHGQPAEKLMNLIRSRFTGEIIEYVSVDSPND